MKQVLKEKKISMLLLTKNWCDALRGKDAGWCRHYERSTTTGGTYPQPFLMYDSGRYSAYRMLIFASIKQLRHLAVAHMWFMDGNYNMAPGLFKELYIIRAPFGTRAVTCVYVHLTGEHRFIDSFSITRSVGQYTNKQYSTPYLIVRS